MKSTPFLVVGFTASAALAAGMLLAAEDRNLFAPERAAVMISFLDATPPQWDQPIGISVQDASSETQSKPMATDAGASRPDTP